VTAGLPAKGKPYGGWEEPKGGLRGHTVGHYLSALALMYASTGDERFKARSELMVAELAKVQEAMPAKGYHPGYLSAFPPEAFDVVEERKDVGGTGPYYICHKIMAGLLDQYVLTGNKQALEVVTKLAGWVKFRADKLSDERMQTMLNTEQGGMVEVLATLYSMTGNEAFLKLARRFEHRAILDPLAKQVDILSHPSGGGLHGNTTVPKIIGAAREYELTGDKYYRDIAKFFWTRVAKSRSFVMGGTTDNECFFPVMQFTQHLGPTTAETCVSYHMLKLTRHLFQWEPSADLMDYYERTLFNHILGSQDPETGMMIYYCPLRPGAFKTFSSHDDSFWCCVGTGMENHSRYPESIYFHDEKSLYVNLFIASQLHWEEKGIEVRQETRFPESDTTRFTFTAAKPTELVVRLRYPSWAQSGISVTVNGEKQKVTGKRGSYVAIERTWKTGDVLELQLPMHLYFEPLPNDPSYVAILIGPLVLAGDRGKEGLKGVQRYGPWAPPGDPQPSDDVPPVVVPTFVRDAAPLVAKIRPAKRALHFETVGLGQPHDVQLVPFYQVSADRYTVYWKVMTQAEYKSRTDALDDLAYVAKSTKRLCQLTGDFDKTSGTPTLSQTGKRFGVDGTDLGSSFEHKGKLYFLFGDTVGRPGARDVMGWTDSKQPDKIALEFHKEKDGKWLPLTVPGISQGAFEIPSGGISIGGVMYVVCTTDHTEKKTMGRSVLASSHDDGLTFKLLHELSRNKFINVSMVLHDGWVYIYGSGEYRKSSPYLARVKPAEIGDKSKMSYFTGLSAEGEPRWSSEEPDAAILFRHDTIGEFSVAYLEPVKRFVMLYNAGEPRGITMRSAKTPWGPWSDGTVIFDPWRDNAYGRFMHISVKFKDTKDSLSDSNRSDEWGSEYGPYIMPRFTTGANGSCRIYYTMSTWNPYQVVIMHSDLELKKK
jgi:DUF1680 family protein